MYSALITVFCNGRLLPAVQSAIATQDRLGELVATQLEDHASFDPAAFTVDEVGITLPVDWHNLAPPIVFDSPVPFTESVFLGLIYARLGNIERAAHFLQGHSNHLSSLACLEQLITNQEIFEKPEILEGYRALHNRAVILHYDDVQQPTSYPEICESYRLALAAAEHPEMKAFTSWHFATLLADAGDGVQSERVLTAAMEIPVSETARMELKSLLSSIWVAALALPAPPGRIEQIKELLLECLTYFNQTSRSLPAAQVLVDAAHLAMVTNSFSEALGYLTRAIDLLGQLGHHELLAQAQFKKGVLFYTWARQEQPQFYRSAMAALLEAARVFTREAAPQQFADIQHLLGIIYAEIPDDTAKKNVWAAVSSASFKAALHFYTREQYPYEYAAVCNHYGNALLKYPPSRNSNNATKALTFFREALAVRDAGQYPVERVLTQMNFLEACWQTGNLQDDADPDAMRLAEMQAALAEIRLLAKDEGILREAEQHQARLEEYKAALAAEKD